tara:strand:+ start:31288 stop:31434 length:147 start_codon:yes stop_codon:yes gene_type:complete
MGDLSQGLFVEDVHLNILSFFLQITDNQISTKIQVLKSKKKGSNKGNP